MTEAFLQFIWQQHLFKTDNLLSVNGERIEIINTGIRNTDSGPDFFNAKIKLDNQLWAGTVEIHLKASDWIKHNHSLDEAYNNVILHVVAENDLSIKTKSGADLPTMVLNVDKKLFENYMKLITNKGPIPCAGFLKEIDEFYIKHWQNRLLVNRFIRKSNEIIDALNKNNNSWEETFYIYLAKNFGFKQNALPFELLAKQTPLKAYEKQKDNLLQIEALLYGQAGFLSDNCDDEYYRLLKREYDYLSGKYNLKPIQKHLWKFMRMRPVNFPTVRIAQFSQILFKNYNFFSKIINSENVGQIKSFFEVNTSEYWANHFVFGKESKKQIKNLGSQSVDIILINTVALFLFSYGIVNNDENFKEKALDLLEKISAEKNQITEKWGRVGVKIQNAFESQALIELFNEYCSKGKCLDCNIGAKIIINEYF